MSGSSYRTLLRASSITGAAQLIGIAASLVKMKAVAVLIGSAGVGLMGLYMNLVATAASIAGLGVGSVGKRQIATAQAEGGEVALGRTRRALFWGTMVLALVGALVFALGRAPIARYILDDEARAAEVAWLSLGIALTVAASSQAALLTGMRRVGDLARIKVGSGVLGVLFGVTILWFWREQGLVAMFLMTPVATFVMGHVYVARLGPPAGPPARLPELAQEWRALVTLGVAFMFSGLLTMLGQLAARTLIQRGLGPEALGHFQASFSIGSTYLGFVLGAMGTDFYPHLSSVIRDRDTAARLVNEQTEVALLLCAPPLLGLLGLAPWVIQLLYSSDFGPSVEVLRWQLMGDILKVMSWPLSFINLAAGAGRTYFMTELTGMAVFVLGIFVGLPLIGVTAAGIAFLALYAAYLPLVWWLGRQRIGFRWSRAVSAQALSVLAAAAAVQLASRWSDALGAALGTTAAVAAGVWALMRLSAVTEARGKLGALAARGERLKAWITNLR